MRFVVKLTSRTGGMFWLSAANGEGVRTITPRESAGLFVTYEEASTAIRKLPPAFKGIGRTFSVESAAD